MKINYFPISINNKKNKILEPAWNILLGNTYVNAQK